MKIFRQLVGNTVYQYESVDEQDKHYDTRKIHKELKEKIVQKQKVVNLMQPLENTRFIIFDTETTGFSPAKGDRIISLGAVVLENGKINETDVFHRMVNPNRSIPREITELTGIDNEMVLNADSFYHVFRDFLDFIDNGVLVAHNANFDIAFINAMLKQYRVKFKYPVIDTLKISYSLYNCIKTHSLDHLLDLNKINPEGRHSALGDSILTAKLLKTFLAKLQKQQVKSLLDLFNYIHYHECC